MNRSLYSLALVLLLSVTSISSAQTERRLSLAERLQAEPVAQLVNDSVKFGDAQRGAIAFYQPAMNCARCHEASVGGRRLGPQLSEKRNVDTSHLIESVLNPSAKINEGFETMKVLLADGIDKKKELQYMVSLLSTSNTANKTLEFTKKS